MKKAIFRLSSYIAEYRLILAALIFAAILTNVFALAAPSISGFAIDCIKGTGDVNFVKIAKILAVLGAFYLLNALFTWLMTYFTNLLSNRAIEKIRRYAFFKLTKMPLSFYDSRPHGDTISRLTNDVDAVSEGLLQGLTQLFSGVVIIIGTLTIMFLRSRVITSAILVITFLCVLASKAIAQHSAQMFRKQSCTVGELGGFCEEYISSQKVVQAFSYEKDAKKRFDEINSRLYDCGQKAQFYSSLVNPTTRYINNLAYIAVGVLGGLSVLSGRLSVGTVSAFLIYATQFARPINDIAAILTQLQSAAAAAERIFTLIDAKSESSDDALPPLKVTDGRVDFRDVCFSYNKDVPLIEHLMLTAKPNKTVAIVGPTGSGKTTIVNLLMRFYDADSGEITIDAQPTDAVTRDSLRRSIAMVLQDTWLFSGTIRDNIAYARPDATDEEIRAAARSAHAEHFIRRLPDGYDTKIAEDGGNLSQGQKQLLTIARAMLSDTEILVLDEATSSVDTMTEQRIQRAFLEMMQNRTAFVIAHRLSTIRGADLILVMKDGKIIEQGTHEELLAAKGFYCEMYNS